MARLAENVTSQEDIEEAILVFSVSYTSGRFPLRDKRSFISKFKLFSIVPWSVSKSYPNR